MSPLSPNLLDPIHSAIEPTFNAEEAGASSSQEDQQSQSSEAVSQNEINIAVQADNEAQSPNQQPRDAPARAEQNILIIENNLQTQ